MISALLVALVVRALIPAGFMPATDRPLSFQICPDGFPAALLADTAGAAGIGATLDPGMGMHAGHPHHLDDGTVTADSAGRDGMLAHAGHHHHADGTLLALAHHHDAPGHNHSSVSSEHCVFAAAAGVFALAFLATFSAPAATLSAPEVPYVSPAFESRRFRIPQPRGPPALS